MKVAAAGIVLLLVGCVSPDRPADRELARGKALLDSGRARGALDPLQLAAGFEPESAVIQSTLGDCYLELGDYLSAQTAYLAAGDLNVTQESNSRGLGHQIEPRTGGPLNARSLNARLEILRALLGNRQFIHTDFVNPDELDELDLLLCRLEGCHRVISSNSVAT